MTAHHAVRMNNMHRNNVNNRGLLFSGNGGGGSNAYAVMNDAAACSAPRALAGPVCLRLEPRRLPAVWALGPAH